MLKCTLNLQCFTILFIIRQLISVYCGLHIQNWCTTEYSHTQCTCIYFIRVTTGPMKHRLIISDSDNSQLSKVFYRAFNMKISLLLKYELVKDSCDKFVYGLDNPDLWKNTHIYRKKCADTCVVVKTNGCDCF